MSEQPWSGVEDFWVQHADASDAPWYWEQRAEQYQEVRVLAIGLALGAGRILLPGSDSELWVDGDRGARLLVRDLSFDFATGSNLQLITCDPPYFVEHGMRIRAPGGVGVMLRRQSRMNYGKPRY